MSYYEQEIVAEVIMLKGERGEDASFLVNTTAGWEAQGQIVTEKGQPYMYSDYYTIDGVKVPAMKIGDGESYLADLPFLTGNRDELVKYMTTTDSEIAAIKSALTGAMHYIGVTTTALSNGATTNPIVIDGKSVTAKSGDIAIYNSLEFVFSDTDNKWHEFGSTGSLKALAFKDTASGKVTPTGTVSKPNFTGTEGNVSVAGTPTGTVSKPTFTGTEGNVSVTGTAAGSVSQPTFTGTEGNVSVSGTAAGSVSQPTFTGTEGNVSVTGTPAGSIAVTPTVTMNTTTVNSITAVGTLPSLTTSVSGEELTISFDAGTLPTKGANTTVATSVKSATATGTFTGSSTTSTGKFTPAGTVSKPTFTGSANTSTGKFTPAGTVSKPTFTGSSNTSTGKFTPAGSVSQPTFTGNAMNSSGQFTPAGSVSQPTFTGNEATVTVS